MKYLLSLTLWLKTIRILGIFSVMTIVGILGMWIKIVGILMCLKSHYFIFNVITKNMLKLYSESKNGILATTLVCVFHFFGIGKLVLLSF